MKDECVQLNIGVAEKLDQTVYEDGDIVIWDNINELPQEQNTIKVNVFLVVLCLEGKIAVNVNTKNYVLHASELLCCMPNSVLNDIMISPDFKGNIMCFSRRIMLEGMRMDNEIWKKAFQLRENPVIHCDDESVALFKEYKNMISLRNKTQSRPYSKEVITSLARAAIFEILAELHKYANSPGGEMLQQKDVLFKSFIELLSSCEVKSRSVVWYAERLFITPKYLSAVCKTVSGRTASDWIKEYVMMDVCYQLEYSSRTIKEVSEYLEFPNISFFGKYVKAHTGFNPTAYRKLLRKKK